MVFRPYPIMTVLAAIGLSILVWLGNWQWGRYSEKIGVAPEVAADAPIVLAPGFVRTGTGIQHVYGIADGESIWRRVVAATRSDTGDPVLLVEDAIGGANPVTFPLPDRAGAGPQEVRIFDRPGSPSPRNNPDASLWYTWDAQGLTAALGLPSDIPVAEPVTLTVRNADNPDQTRTTINPYGAPKPIDPLPPQRHFGYALTWWGLGGALVGVYLAFHIAHGRLRIRRPA